MYVQPANKHVSRFFIDLCVQGNPIMKWGRQDGRYILVILLTYYKCMHSWFSSEIIHLYGYVHIWKLDRKIPMLYKWYFAFSHLLITDFPYTTTCMLCLMLLFMPNDDRKWQEPGGGTFSTCLKLSLFFVLFFFCITVKTQYNEILRTKKICSLY